MKAFSTEDVRALVSQRQSGPNHAISLGCLRLRTHACVEEMEVGVFLGMDAHLLSFSLGTYSLHLLVVACPYAIKFICDFFLICPLLTPLLFIRFCASNDIYFSANPKPEEGGMRQRNGDFVPACDAMPSGGGSTFRPQRVVQRGAKDNVVVDSPYGSDRALYGWGDLFHRLRRAVVPGYPNIHIGVSSLNAVPGKDRRMKTLITQYQRKFNCVEHCYTFHNVGDEAMWDSWREFSLLPTQTPVSASSSRRTSGQLRMSANRGSTDGEGIVRKRGRESHSGDATEKVEASLGYDDDNDSAVNCEQRPPPFMYAIKANRYLTHTRMLAMDEATEEHVMSFFAGRCTMLGRSLGPVLLQLPPQFAKTSEHMKRIELLAARLPKGIRVAVEFRHVSWYVEETWQLLRRIRWAQVVVRYHDTPTGSVPVDVGVPFMYVRLHGAIGLHVGDYGPTLLSLWAERIAEFVRGPCAGMGGANQSEEREVFFFFNNSDSHVGGATSSVVDATFLAEKLQQLLPKADAGAKVVECIDISSRSCSCDTDDVVCISDTIDIRD
uniref:Uncharacterized protein n=1 Tax=Trypanosoma congolense (strain IL3000) TaxID=1068625 RepID=G0UWN0_TRYCI|nr:conserved hypothetical protein [Trypanosoma congolense IL3000]